MSGLSSSSAIAGWPCWLYKGEGVWWQDVMCVPTFPLLPAIRRRDFTDEIIVREGEQVVSSPWEGWWISLMWQQWSRGSRCTRDIRGEPVGVWGVRAPSTQSILGKPVGFRWGWRFGIGIKSPGLHIDLPEGTLSQQLQKLPGHILVLAIELPSSVCSPDCLLQQFWWFLLQSSFQKLKGPPRTKNRKHPPLTWPRVQEGVCVLWHITV